MQLLCWVLFDVNGLFCFPPFTKHLQLLLARALCSRVTRWNIPWTKTSLSCSDAAPLIGLNCLSLVALTWVASDLRIKANLLRYRSAWREDFILSVNPSRVKTCKFKHVRESAIQGICCLKTIVGLCICQLRVIYVVWYMFCSRQSALLILFFRSPTKNCTRMVRAPFY